MGSQDAYRDDPDVELMLSFQNGEDDAFDALFAKYSRPLINFANRMLGSMDRAEEVAQEVFLEVHRARTTYLPQAKFTTWIYRITTNRCLNELRRPEHRIMVKPATGNEDGSPEPEPVADQPDSLQKLEAKRLQEAIGRALAVLPDPQRTALVMCRYHAMSYKEAAEVMDTTESAVKSLIHRATVSLRDRLKSYL